MHDGPVRGCAFAATALLYGLAGALLGVTSGFLAGAGPRIGPFLVSVGALLGVVGVPALVVLACRLSGRAGAGAAAYGAWLVVVMALALRHHWDPALNFHFDEVPVVVYGGAAAGSIACGLGSLWIPRPLRRAPMRRPALEEGDPGAEDV